jgi:hypothetical protein
MQAIRNRSAFAEVPEKCRKAHRRRSFLSGRERRFFNACVSENRRHTDRLLR